MKTAISLSDDTFERATRRADELGVSRSEFFATAAKRYLEELDAHAVSEQIDAALDLIEGIDESSAIAVEAGHTIVSHGAEEW